MNLAIRSASSSTDFSACQMLFQEYGDWLKEDICLAGFTAEIAGLPGKYAPPQGGLLLALLDKQPAGCVAIRPFDHRSAEAKRLWVRPEFRQHGIGIALMKAMLLQVEEAGYARVVFDTLSKMQRALQMYQSMGFQSREGPDPNIFYFEKTFE